MNKKEIIEKLIECKRGEIKRLERLLAEKREEVIEAEGKKSHCPENPKRDCADQLRLLENKIQAERNCLDALRSISKARKDRVDMGSLVTLECEEGLDICLIVPREGLCSNTINGKTILCTSVNAPLIRLIANKRAGEVVNFRSNAFKIAEVQ